MFLFEICWLFSSSFVGVEKPMQEDRILEAISADVSLTRSISSQCFFLGVDC